MRGGGCIQICVSLGVRRREGLDYVMVRGTWRQQLHAVKGVEVACGWQKVPLLVHPLTPHHTIQFMRPRL